MSDFKIKVNLELSDDLKEQIDEYVRESVLKAIKNIDEEYISTTVSNGVCSSEIIYEPNGIYIKFKER